MKFELPRIENYADYEPYIDAQTMEIHHSKHHQAYLNKFNKAIESLDENKSAEEIVADWQSYPDDIKTSIRNNGGGYINHSLFWNILKKDVAFEGEIAKAIKTKFNSFELFKAEFSKAAATRFGSGWAWLIVNEEGGLEITSTSNQDTPLSEGKNPILCLDVWEHAYYLKYQNKRPDYIEAFFNVINWEKVNELYLAAKQ